MSRKRLTDWLYKTYDITFLPNRFYIKLDEIYKGTYKNLSCSISPSVLLDMWQRKINYLNKVNFNNKNKGKIMDKQQRINYDLSILLSKYDSYLNWIKEQKLIQEEIEKDSHNQKINYKNLSINNKKEKEETKKINIDNIIDEI